MRDRPYTGLMPFSERQAPFFFGRDGERKIVAANLLASRLTVLYGPSGVGKSSLLNAGVASYLRRLAQQNMEEYGAPEFSVIVFGAWRDDPRCGLGRLLGEQISDDVPGRLAEKLDRVSSRRGCDLLVILDQFEEYFLYHPHEDSESGFASEFAEAVNRSVRASFLISIREDSSPSSIASKAPFLAFWGIACGWTTSTSMPPARRSRSRSNSSTGCDRTINPR